MKLIYLVIGLMMLSSCADGPIVVRVKNCKYVGAGLSDCEEIPDSVVPGPK